MTTNYDLKAGPINIEDIQTIRKTRKTKKKFNNKKKKGEENSVKSMDIHDGGIFFLTLRNGILDIFANEVNL